jgi:hypothetical protein
VGKNLELRKTMPTETVKLPTAPSPQKIAFDEAKAFMDSHPNYFACKENSIILDNYFKMHNLEPTYPNFVRAYEELTENAQLHISAPDPRLPGGNNPYSKTPKPKIAPYRGSRYDKTEVSRLKAQIAVMSASELKEFMAVNQWEDFPHWLKAGS